MNVVGGVCSKPESTMGILPTIVLFEKNKTEAHKGLDAGTCLMGSILQITQMSHTPSD